MEKKCDIILTYCWNRVGYTIQRTLTEKGLKVMGVIAAALFVSGGRGESITDIPTWVPLACCTLIALGTMSGS